MFQDLNHQAPTGLEYDCPSCGAPMAVIDRFVLQGVPGPVEHVKIRCPRGHWYTIPTESYAQAGTREEVSASSRRA